MTPTPSPAELQATVELLKAENERLQTLAEYQQRRKVQLHAENQKKISFLQDEVKRLQAELVMERGKREVEE
jgi:uncharacterized small protein (DUF1192 family)